ncbi:hypothetical protein FRB99_006527 [Tulasnella sp. 403]|nr:hypothetical protein FRB99_006527 [Tulasnella sp. 403]
MGLVQGQGFRSATKDPLLLIAMSPDGEQVDTQIDLISHSAKSHYNFCPGNNSIGAKDKASEESLPAIEAFLQRHPNTRTVVILNYHCEPTQGLLAYHSIQSNTGDRQFEYQTLDTLLEEWLSARILKRIREVSATKALFLLSCGSTLTLDESRAKCEGLLRNNTIDFILGFSSTTVVPTLSAFSWVEFFEDRFFDEPKEESLELGDNLTGYNTYTFQSRLRAFSGDTVINEHSGTVLMERLDNGTIASSEFRLGFPGICPFGLPMLSCPFCSSTINVTLKPKTGKGPAGLTMAPAASPPRLRRRTKALLLLGLHSSASEADNLGPMTYRRLSAWLPSEGTVDPALQVLNFEVGMSDKKEEAKRKQVSSWLARWDSGDVVFIFAGTGRPAGDMEIEKGSGGSISPLGVGILDL